MHLVICEGSWKVYLLQDKSYFIVDLAKVLSVDFRLKGKIIVDCTQLVKPFKIVDCRLKTCFSCRFVGRNLRFEMKIVVFVILCM